MTLGASKSRIKRLEGNRPPREGECPQQCVGQIVEYRRGRPVPSYDVDATVPCRNCGGKHTLLLEIVIVDGDGEEVRRAEQGEVGQA
jgi:hypothetical protein